MAPPEVESWRVDAPTRPCAFCRQNVDGDGGKSCPRCAAVYHPDCWVSNSRRCAVYGCEPGQKPAATATRPVRPSLQPPPLPRSGMNLGWLVPLLIIVAINVTRFAMGGRSSQPSPPPPVPPIVQELRQVDVPSHEALIPALADDVPALLEEAQALESSTSALLSLPGGRLTPDVRRMLRDTVLSDVVSLQRALKLIRRCAAARPDAGLQRELDRLRTLIGRKRRLLVDLTGATAPD